MRTNSVNPNSKSSVYALAIDKENAFDKSVFVFQTDMSFDDLESYIRKLVKRPYNLRYKCVDTGLESALHAPQLNTLSREIANVRLHKAVYTHVKTTVEVINLPKYVTVENGVLVITIPGHDYHDPELCREEHKIVGWILDTFKNACYSTNRTTFALKIDREEYDETKQHKYQYCLSPSGNGSIEVLTRTFERELVEL